MITEVLVPALVFLLMGIVGTDLAPMQLRAMVPRRALVTAGTLAQAALLPLVALGICRIWSLEAELAAGLVLIAACPGGALSNFYCLLARADVALSVTLTAASSLASFLLLPGLLAVALPFVLPAGAVELPVGGLVLQLLLFLVLPIVLGMLARQRWPGALAAISASLRLVGLVLLAALIALIAWDQWSVMTAIMADGVTAALLFTLAAGLCGWVVGALLGLGRGGRYVFSVEFAVRNLGVATLVATGSLARPEFAAFGALFVTVQFPIMLLVNRMVPVLTALDAGARR